MSQSTIFDQRPDILKIFVDAFAKTLGGFAQAQVSPGIAGADADPTRADLANAGLIRYESQKFAVEIMLAFPEGFSLAPQSDGFGEAPAPSKDEAGEILNVAFGTIDPQLRGLGLPTVSSFPITVSGAALRILLKKLTAKSLAQPYVVDGKLIYLEFFPAGTFQEQWRYTKVAPKK